MTQNSPQDPAEFLPPDVLNVFRQLFPSPDDVEARLRGALENARAIDSPAKVFVVALIKVLDVSIQWQQRAIADPDATIRYDEVSAAIMNAIEEGLTRG